VALQDDKFPFLQFKQQISDILRRLAVLERPTGTSVGSLVSQVQTAIANIASAVTTALAGGFHSTGTAVIDGGITSAGVYALDVSTLPGTRRTNWTVSTGQIGYAPSSILTKNILGDVEISAAQFLACGPAAFEYLGQVDIRDNPENPNYDPEYVVPVELGHVAEWLEENGCGAFVFRHEDGSPAGIDYAGFGAVGFVVVGRDHEQRIRTLENMFIAIGDAVPDIPGGS
jgi:hypothetical protein